MKCCPFRRYILTLCFGSIPSFRWSGTGEVRAQGWGPLASGLTYFRFRSAPTELTNSFWLRMSVMSSYQESWPMYSPLLLRKTLVGGEGDCRKISERRRRETGNLAKWLGRQIYYKLHATTAPTTTARSLHECIRQKNYPWHHNSKFTSDTNSPNWDRMFYVWFPAS